MLSISSLIRFFMDLNDGYNIDGLAFATISILFHSFSSSIRNQLTKTRLSGSYPDRMTSFCCFSLSRTPPRSCPSVVMVMVRLHFILPRPEVSVFMFLVSVYWCFSSKMTQPVLLESLFLVLVVFNLNSACIFRPIIFSFVALKFDCMTLAYLGSGSVTMLYTSFIDVIA